MTLEGNDCGDYVENSNKEVRPKMEKK